MAIDRIPGVGPTNSDIATSVAAAVPNSAAITAAVPTAAAIATAVAAPSAATIAAAVAAPSAATIAAAVAAPSAATIASAVAAPSSATIATAVAAAVPTRANIQSDIGTYGLSPNAWTVVSSVTFNNTSLSASFTSLSGYKKYRVLFPYTTGPVATWFLRLNGDTGNNYSSIRWSPNSGTGTATTNGDNINLPGPSGGSSSGGIFTLDIDFATLACHKFVSTNTGYGRVVSSDTLYNTNGIYQSTSAISSITITGTTNNFVSGTVYLLGAN
jgi:hypothetical protein